MTRDTSVRRVCVVGSGVAGLSAALELASRGVAVDLLSARPASHAGGALFRDGIAAALAEGDAKDSPTAHASDMAAAAVGSAVMPVLRHMAEDAPIIVALLERMGVPFDRTPEGMLAVHRAPGSSIARSVAAGSVTGHHVIIALDEQLRRLEREPVRDARGASVPGETLVRRLIPFELVGLVRDDAGVTVGIVAQDLRSMTMAAFPYDAVLLATGGYAGLFADSGASRAALGSGIAVAIAEGAVLTDIDSVFSYPLGIAGPSKIAALPDSLRGQRARIFNAKEGTPAVDIAALPERERAYITPVADLESPPPAVEVVAAIAKARAKHGAVYLDLSHKKSDQALTARYADIAALCERWTGKGLFDGPIPIRPVVGRTLGGLFVDGEVGADDKLRAASARSQATSIPGLYAAGGAASSPFGTKAAACDLLLGDLHGGRLAAEGVVAYRLAMTKSAVDLPKSLFDGAQKRCEEAYEKLLARAEAKSKDEPETARGIQAELATLLGALAPSRDPELLAEAVAAVDALEARAKRAPSADTASHENREAPFLRALTGGLVIAKAAIASAVARKEGDASRRIFMRVRDGAAEAIDSVTYVAAGKSVTVHDGAAGEGRANDG